MVNRWMTTRSQRMPQLAAPGTNGVITIGISSGGFPFAAVQDNELAGFDVELGRRFAASLGKEARFADQEFSGLIAALVSGKVDVIIADMFVTPERQKQIDFSDPYFEQDNVAFTRKANTVAQAVAQAAEPAAPSLFSRVAASFDANILQERRYLLLWDGLKVTVIISLLSTLFGTLLGAAAVGIYSMAFMLTEGLRSQIATIIGRVLEREQGIELIREQGEHAGLPFGGWDHFRA